MIGRTLALIPVAVVVALAVLVSQSQAAIFNFRPGQGVAASLGDVLSNNAVRCGGSGIV